MAFLDITATLDPGFMSHIDNFRFFKELEETLGLNPRFKKGKYVITCSFEELIKCNDLIQKYSESKSESDEDESENGNKYNPPRFQLPADTSISHTALTNNDTADSESQGSNHFPADFKVHQMADLNVDDSTIPSLEPIPIEEGSQFREYSANGISVKEQAHITDTVSMLSVSPDLKQEHMELQEQEREGDASIPINSYDGRVKLDLEPEVTGKRDSDNDPLDSQIPGDVRNRFLDGIARAFTATHEEEIYFEADVWLFLLKVHADKLHDLTQKCHVTFDEGTCDTEIQQVTVKAEAQKDLRQGVDDIQSLYNKVNATCYRNRCSIPEGTTREMKKYAFKAIKKKYSDLVVKLGDTSDHIVIIGDTEATQVATSDFKTLLISPRSSPHACESNETATKHKMSPISSTPKVFGKRHRQDGVHDPSDLNIVQEKVPAMKSKGILKTPKPKVPEWLPEITFADHSKDPDYNDATNVLNGDLPPDNTDGHFNPPTLPNYGDSLKGATAQSEDESPVMNYGLHTMNFQREKLCMSPKEQRHLIEPTDDMSPYRRAKLESMQQESITSLTKPLLTGTYQAGVSKLAKAHEYGGKRKEDYINPFEAKALEQTPSTDSSPSALNDNLTADEEKSEHFFDFQLPEDSNEVDKEISKSIDEPDMEMAVLASLRQFEEEQRQMFQGYSSNISETGFQPKPTQMCSMQKDKTDTSNDDGFDSDEEYARSLKHSFKEQKEKHARLKIKDSEQNGNRFTSEPTKSDITHQAEYSESLESNRTSANENNELKDPENIGSHITSITPSNLTTKTVENNRALGNADDAMDDEDIFHSTVDYMMETRHCGSNSVMQSSKGDIETKEETELLLANLKGSERVIEGKPSIALFQSSGTTNANKPVHVAQSADSLEFNECEDKAGDNSIITNGNVEPLENDRSNTNNHTNKTNESGLSSITRDILILDSHVVEGKTLTDNSLGYKEHLRLLPQLKRQSYEIKMLYELLDNADYESEDTEKMIDKLLSCSAHVDPLAEYEQMSAALWSDTRLEAANQVPNIPSMRPATQQGEERLSKGLVSSPVITEKDCKSASLPVLQSGTMRGDPETITSGATDAYVSSENRYMSLPNARDETKHALLSKSNKDTEITERTKRETAQHNRKYAPVPQIPTVIYQPKDGNMETRVDPSYKLPGYNSGGTIQYTFDFPSGRAEEDCPFPRERYLGTHFKTFLPINEEGNEVGRLIKAAFDAGGLFTVKRDGANGKHTTVPTVSLITDRRKFPDDSYLDVVKQSLLKLMDKLNEEKHLD